jgi:hypothetical protein
MTDIEDLLRERLTTAAPSFEPVSIHSISDRVQRRRKTIRGATMVAAAVLSGAAIVTPLALSGGLTGSSTSNSNSDSGAAAGVAVPLDRGTASRSSGLPPATPSPGSVFGGGPTTHDCPSPFAGHIAIDYVDFVMLGAQQYLAGQTGVPVTVPANSILKPLAMVDCELSKILPDPSYKPVSGDAGYLPIGTVLYAIKGQPSTYRIAAKVGGQFRVYQKAPPR